MASNGAGETEASEIICWNIDRRSTVAEAPGSMYSTATLCPCRSHHSRICRTWSGMERSFSACFAVDTRAYKATIICSILVFPIEHLHVLKQFFHFRLDKEIFLQRYLSLIPVKLGCDDKRIVFQFQSRH